MTEGSSRVQLTVVAPVYNESENIKPFLDRTSKILNKMGLTHEIVFCMDPSSDNTEQILCEEAECNPDIKLLIFSRRFGQPAATMAGILYSKGEVCVVIDVDLQDPPELIEEMYNRYKQGYEVVYAKRRSRKGETLTKKIVSYIGYKIINKLTDVGIPRNTGDFRLMSRRVVEQLRSLNETHGFLRGLIAFVGFKQTFVEYDRDPRFTGKGNYNRLFGSFKIGLNGLISFSSRPLQMMSIMGAIIAGFSFLLGVWYIIQKILNANLTPGLSTTVLIVTFFAGVQLLCLGLMGEYIGRIYEEVKRRPMYIVDKIIDKQR